MNSNGAPLPENHQHGWRSWFQWWLLC